MTEEKYTEKTPGAGQDAGPGSSSEKSSLGKRILLEVLDWVRILVIAVLLAFLVNSVLIMNTRVPSGSMEDTIPDPSRVLSLRFVYWFSEPERGDVVIFEPPDGDNYLYVKRIIGLPGETVTIRNGLVYIDDSEEPLDEPNVKGTPGGDFGPFEVPEGCYFMMGDNRNNSNDARYWNNPYVAEDKIYAKAVLIYWPELRLVK